jgi:hypothetical protein
MSGQIVQILTANDYTARTAGDNTDITQLDITITPTNTSNVLIIELIINGNTGWGLGNWCQAKIFKDSDENPVALSYYYDAYTSYDNGPAAASMKIRYKMVAGTTSAIDFHARFAGGNNTTIRQMNQDYGGLTQGVGSSMKITEITA